MSEPELNNKAAREAKVEDPIVLIIKLTRP